MKKSILLCWLALFPVVAAMCAAPGEVRPPTVAGTFYPADPAELAGMLEQMFTHSRPFVPRVRPLAIIAPHAGYEYSGLVAAAGYRQLKGFEYKTVVVVSPSHREYFSFASVLCRGAYRTPLGEIPVDSALAGKIVASGGGAVRCGREGHFGTSGGMDEHALEVQLPFLQTALVKFSLVPIVMGSQNAVDCRGLGAALAKAIGKRKDVLLVASSDLSHFHPYAEAKSIDSRTAAHVAGFDPDGLLGALASGEVEACGGGPVAVVMLAAASLGADRSAVLSSANSGDVTGEQNRVVGYLSAMLYRSSDSLATAAQTNNSGEKMDLTDKEKTYLLQLARKTVEYSVAGGDKPDCKAITPVLAEKRGAFVTLKKHGELRGCIGYIVALKPLVETVREMAMSAALHDRRFSPVDKTELADLEYEISVLSPIQPLTDPAQVKVGRDGLIVRRGVYQGLLLPQVPVEYGWDRETFLAQTCRKAGLPPDAWKDEGTQLEVFSAEVFGDRDYPNKQ